MVFAHESFADVRDVWRIGIEVDSDNRWAASVASVHHIYCMRQVGCESGLCGVTMTSRVSVCREECEGYVGADDYRAVYDSSNVVSSLKLRGVDFEPGSDEAWVVVVGYPRRRVSRVCAWGPNA